MAVHPDDRHPEIRAGDADREEVIQRLRSHTADGRLSMDEFEDRVAMVWVARTFGDLDRITADLPVPATTQQPATRPRPSGPPVRHRPPPRDDGVRTVSASLVMIAIFLVVIWAMTGAGYFWPIWPILAFALVIGLKSVNRPR